MTSSAGLFRVAGLPLSAAHNYFDELQSVPPDVRDAIRLSGGERINEGTDAIRNYISRMASRPTPFGLLTSTTDAYIGSTTQLHGCNSGLTVLVMVDFEVLERMVDDVVAKAPAELVPLKLSPLTSVGSLAVRFFDGSGRNANAKELVRKPAIDAVVSTVRRIWSGSAIEIASELSKTDLFNSVLPEQVVTLVLKLQQSGLLIPDTGLLVPGEYPSSVARRLARRCGDSRLQVFELIDELCQPVAREEVLNRIGRLTASIETSFAWFRDVESQKRFHLVQTSTASRATVQKEFIDRVRDALRILEYCFPESDPLEGFKTTFELATEGSELPLLEVIDPVSSAYGQARFSEACTKAGIMRARPEDELKVAGICMRAYSLAQREGRKTVNLKEIAGPVPAEFVTTARSVLLFMCAENPTSAVINAGWRKTRRHSRRGSGPCRANRTSRPRTPLLLSKSKLCHTPEDAQGTS